MLWRGTAPYHSARFNDQLTISKSPVQFVILDDSRQTRGPYSREELGQLFETATIRLDTPVRMIGSEEWVPYGQLLGARATKAEPSTGETSGPGHRSFREQATDDWRALKRHILVPWQEVREMRWLDNRRLIGVAAIGLFPLLIIALFTNAGRIEGAYWAMAFYFSALWAVFFYYVFPAPGVTIRNCLICFFGTGLFSVSLLQIAYYLIANYTELLKWTTDPNPLTSWAGWVFGVGLPEEICKMLVLIYLARNNEPFQPQTMLYYGLMAGLGFGIYEGVAYQQRTNLGIARGVGEYYILNVVRLTALPFIHAIWTAIAGYFVGFAYQYPERKRGLLIIAVAMPAFLHGTYNAVTGTSVLSSLGVALVSVFALNLYLAKSRDFERALQRK